MKYNKLVRDKIPEIIIKSGGKPKIHIARKNEYWLKLKEKLREEVEEFIKDESETELADILEIVDAIASFKKWSKINLDKVEKDRVKKRGGFKKRIILEES